ncbi:EAL domain-containing protein [Psychromonas sp. KJ10-10]|uniref:EAL domain-containing protein n=1 Tax=Psychromonas sp. KJ10-10 TaxID=3391823 RepID=UPI0039B391B3
MKGSSICLEITERQFLQPSKVNDKYLNRYRNLGVSFAMDDFGSGYSNLSYLLDKPFDTLKIDRSFISRIGDIKKSEEVVKATINIAKALDLKTVAEGIETQEQLDFVLSHGCDFVQGFYLQVPAPIEELTHLLSEDADVLPEE